MLEHGPVADDHPQARDWIRQALTHTRPKLQQSRRPTSLLGTQQQNLGFADACLATPNPAQRPQSCQHEPSGGW